MNTAKRFAGRRVGCWGAEEKGVWRVTVIEMYYIYMCLKMSKGIFSDKRLRKHSSVRTNSKVEKTVFN